MIKTFHSLSYDEILEKPDLWSMSCWHIRGNVFLTYEVLHQNRCLRHSDFVKFLYLMVFECLCLNSMQNRANYKRLNNAFSIIGFCSGIVCQQLFAKQSPFQWSHSNQIQCCFLFTTICSHVLQKQKMYKTNLKISTQFQSKWTEK